MVVYWWFFSWKSNASPGKQYQSTHDNLIICRKQDTIIPRILILEAKERGSGCLIQDKVFSDAIGHILDLFLQGFFGNITLCLNQFVISFICYMQILIVWALWKLTSRHPQSMQLSSFSIDFQDFTQKSYINSNAYLLFPLEDFFEPWSLNCICQNNRMFACL